MALTETVCSECEHATTKATEHCPECGAGPDPWEQRTRYDFERDVDLPFVFSNDVYRDNHGLWRSFCAQAFDRHELRGSDIENLPSGIPDMKYEVFEVWYKLDEDLELHGPFLSKEDAESA